MTQLRAPGPRSRRPKAPARQRPRRLALRLLLGTSLSLALLALFVRQVDIRTAVGDVSRLSPLTICAAVGLILASLAVMAVRWHLLLLAAGSSVGIRRLVAPVCFGRGANNLVPARGGDLLRIESLRQRERLRFWLVAGTLVAERILDGVVLACWILLGGLLLGRHGIILATGAVVLAGALIAGALLTLALAQPERADRLVRLALLRLPRRWRRRAYVASGRFAAGLRAFRRSGLLLLAFGATVLMWLLEVAMYALVARDLGLALDTGAFFLLHGAGNVALALPSAAAGIGTFDFVVLVVARRVGVPEADVGGYVLALHALDVLPITLLALILLRTSLPAFFTLSQPRGRRRRRRADQSA